MARRQPDGSCVTLTCSPWGTAIVTTLFGYRTGRSRAGRRKSGSASPQAGGSSQPTYQKSPRMAPAEPQPIVSQASICRRHPVLGPLL
jgi:hypothetical protein